MAGEPPRGSDTRAGHRNRRPDWWPEHEKWPPHGDALRLSHAFVLRLGLALLILVVVVAAAFGLAFWALGTEPAPQIHQRFDRLLITLALLAIAGMGLAFAYRRIVSPVASVVEGSDRLAHGDYSVRVDERGPREVRTMARAFNDMAAKLEKTEAQRRALLADVSHELRTPLTVIQGDLEALIDGVYPRDDEHLQTLLDESRLLGRLIEDLRTLALADAGALVLHCEPTAADQLVGDTIAAFASSAAARGVALTASVEPDLPAISADPVRIRQVLSNLVTNSIRYTPTDGAIEVSACHAGDCVRFAVSDTGAGIAPDDLPLIFDRFHKAADSKGSGLGLTIARDLIEAHGGSIAAESEGRGRGTEVWFVLAAAE